MKNLGKTLLGNFIKNSDFLSTVKRLHRNSTPRIEYLRWSKSSCTTSLLSRSEPNPVKKRGLERFSERLDRV